LEGDEGRIAEMAYRLTGSPDLYQHDDRRPTRVSTSSRRTMVSRSNDLVSYNENTTKPTATTIRMATITIFRGTPAWKADRRS